MADKFKVGDLVRLKSGGPIMTVYTIDDDDIHTNWFTDDGKEEWHYFPIATLEKVEKPSKPE